jgi:hypothetical protein
MNAGLTTDSEMINLKTRVDIYENLLEQLKAQVDSAGQLAITKALQGVVPVLIHVVRSGSWNLTLVLDPISR